MPNFIRERDEKIESKCPFCRHPMFKSQEEANRNMMKRVEANDPVALREGVGDATTTETTKVHLSI